MVRFFPVLYTFIVTNKEQKITMEFGEGARDNCEILSEIIWTRGAWTVLNRGIRFALIRRRAPGRRVL